MLTSEKLILVELHKAGSARLKKLLGDVLGGESSGKQKNYADELAAMGKPIVGFVCNPLTWYLALWRQGCDGKGELHKRLTDDARWVQLIARRNIRAVKEDAKPDAKAIPEGWGAERAKSFWYGDEQNAEAFREWLKAVLGVPGLRKLLDHGYGGSPMNRMAGLMTYDFFIMFVRNAENMEKSVDTLEALQAAHQAGKITDRFIRSEAIGVDLLRTLEARGPASLEVCALLTKPSRRTVDLPVRYTGFEIPDKFAIGYGLDYAERYRNLPYVAALVLSDD